FGTATDSAFYKVAPDGKLRWEYRNPTYKRAKLTTPERDGGPRPGDRFQSSENGVMCSALVHGDSVYFGDLGGWFYALDRTNGSERWRINSRAEPFPGAHPVNMFFASPIMADGKLIVAGGTLEQVISASPFYRGSTGRGFVMAVEPKDGHII